MGKFRLSMMLFFLCSTVFCAFAVDEWHIDYSKMNYPERRKYYPTPLERDSLKGLQFKYLKIVDPLRYEFHTRMGKFADYPMSPKKDVPKDIPYKEIHTPEYCMYKYAAAVYGKVEKIESYSISFTPAYHTVIYIMPYETFKDAVTDSNRFVVVKTYYWGKETQIIIAGMKSFVIGEDVIVFLEDFPWTLFGISPLGGHVVVPGEPREKALKMGKVSSTSTQGYYEYACALNVEGDSVRWKPVGGARGSKFWNFGQKYSLEETLRTLKKVETEWKSYKEGG